MSLIARCLISANEAKGQAVVSYRPRAVCLLFSQVFAYRLLMLTANRLSKSFGVETILDAVTFSVNPGERIGLVGPNGCG